MIMNDIIKRYKNRKYDYIFNKNIDEAIIREGFKRGYITIVGICGLDKNIPDYTLVDRLYYTFVDYNSTLMIITISHEAITVEPVEENFAFPSINSDNINITSIEEKSVNGILKNIEELLEIYYKKCDK